MTSFRRRAVTMSLAALCLSSCGSGTYVVVSFAKQGEPSVAVKSIDLQFMLGGKSANVSLRDKGGADLVFPRDGSFEIRSGSGNLQIAAVARDGAGVELGRGSGSVNVVRGDVTRLTVTIAFGDLSQPKLIMDRQPSYDFGTVAIGSNSAPASFTVTNDGAGPSGALGAAALGGTDASQFGIVDDGCTGQTLAVGASCVVTARMQAAAPAGVKSATLSVSASPGGSASTTLTGNAATPGAIALSPSPVDFMAVGAGLTKDVTMTATNNGGVATGAITIAIEGSDAAHFSLVAGMNGCDGKSLEPSGSCTFVVRFAPSSGGAKSASVVANATPGGPGAATLQGQGTTAPSLAFATAGPTSIGIIDASSTMKTSLTLLNNGTQASGPLTLGITSNPTMSITGGTCAAGTLVAGGGSCTVEVTFAPSGPGAQTVTVTGNATPGGIATHMVTGTGRTFVRVNVIRAGNGTGTITGPVGSPDNNGINCPGDCTEQYAVTSPSQTVTLALAPGPTTAVGWSAAGCSRTGCVVPLTSSPVDVTVTLTLGFSLQLTTTAVTSLSGDPTATGSIKVILPEVFSCTGSCSSAYTNLTDVSFVAVPDPGFGFAGWEGFCNTQLPTCAGYIEDNMTVIARFSPLNRIFVSPQLSDGVTAGAGAGPGSIGGLTAADTICQNAANGTFNGTFKAWLSTSGNNAKDRFPGARGWMRPPPMGAGGFAGMPVLDSISSYTTTSKLLGVVKFDKLGVPVPTDEVATGTGSDGIASGSDCSAWSSQVGSATTGDPKAAGARFTTGAFEGCNSAIARLYCMGTDYNAAVIVQPPMGVRRAFVSVGTRRPGVDLSSVNDADTLCQTEAMMATLPNHATFKALLATIGGSAPMRFNLTGPTWVRVDGIPILPMANLLDDDPSVFDAALNVTAAGAYVAGARVWSGGLLGANGSATTTCNNWSSNSAANAGTFGVADFTDSRMNSDDTLTCDGAGIASRFYCLEN